MDGLIHQTLYLTHLTCYTLYVVSVQIHICTFYLDRLDGFINETLCLTCYALYVVSVQIYIQCTWIDWMV